jgi:translation initiation factor IF-3
MEIEGTVYKIGQEEQATASYKKRELVIKTKENYPQTICIEFPQGKCNEYIDKLQIGQEVTIGINLRGREWTNPQGEVKYFNSINGWSVK